MKKYRLLKLVGLVILTMITLVAISFLEVAIYSMLVEPDQDEAFYEAHAQITAPWISGIFGFIVFFLVVRYWAKKSYPDLSRLSILYPTTYVLLDLSMLLTIGGIEWSTFYIIFLLANGAKYAGSLMAYRLYVRN